MHQCCRLVRAVARWRSAPSRARCASACGRAELAERHGGGEARGHTPAGAAAARPTSTTPVVGAAEVAAASTGPGPMLSRAGTTVRTTSGSATSAWPTGTSHHEARQLKGAVSKVITSPSPTVTADVASGSIRPVSSSQPCRWATVTATAAKVRRRPPAP